MAEFRVLGPVEASVDGEPIALPAAKPRALFAALLLDRNRVVPVSRLIDDLWGEVPPETAMKALQGYVSQLRKAIGPERLLTRPPGYELRVEDGELDLDRFERLPPEGGGGVDAVRRGARALARRTARRVLGAVRARRRREAGGRTAGSARGAHRRRPRPGPPRAPRPGAGAAGRTGAAPRASARATDACALSLGPAGRRARAL